MSRDRWTHHCRSHIIKTFGGRPGVRYHNQHLVKALPFHLLGRRAGIQRYTQIRRMPADMENGRHPTDPQRRRHQTHGKLAPN